MQYCKRFLIACCTLFFSAPAFSQSSPEEIVGLWTGLMYNDTTELSYRYEIAISEKNGKLSGFSHTFFILDGKEYYGVKKIKITKEGNKLITQDIKMIDNNYPIKPPKGVYVLNVLNVEMKNAVMVLSGMFETNRTKQYAPATGYIHVEKKTDFNQSALVPHLQQLGLADELSFAGEEKAKETAVVKTKPVEKQKKIKDQKPVKEKVVPEKEKVVVKTEPSKPAATKPVQAGADISNRIIETIQSVNYTSDSLVLAVYDNGEIDGDTVTVLMNGEVIMPKVGLSTNAVRKTIYTKDITGSIQIVMYAENLGSLPPNTGLLIVYDGPVRYEIRFSGDLKKNSAIVFKKKEH